MRYSKPRGTVDLLDQDLYNLRMLQSVITTVANFYNYKEIKTPIFESAELFKKSVGEETDIVTKEIYTFMDKGGREMALRPEGTASAIRAIVENKKLLNTNVLTKVFYFGEMFRYERPQNGRQRQFHQFGVECLGDFNEHDEIDVIFLAESILEVLKITDYTLEINNLGSNESRAKWIEALKKYFAKYEGELSEDSKRRLEKNPLRILDDKEDGKKEFVKKAPKLNAFLTNEEKAYFKKITTLLDTYDIKYKVNEMLVRGLDYYNGLVFEFISNSEKLTAQSTIIGGGRYDSLVKMTGGPDVKGIGFAIGIERLLQIVDTNSNMFNMNNLDVIILPLSEKTLRLSNLIANSLRLSYALSCEVSNKTFKLDKHFKFVDKVGCKNVVILDNDLLKKEKVKVKNQLNRQEVEIDIRKLGEFLNSKN